MCPVSVRFSVVFLLAFAATANDAAASEKRVRVIVALRDPADAPSETRSEVARQHRMDVIREVQQRVLDRVGSQQANVYARWSLIPGFAAEVTEAALQRLKNDPDVLKVDPDAGGSGHLAESVPLIHGDVVRALGYTGAGVTVAVLDTGVNRTHADLQSAVVEEACFCTNFNGTGCCPNGSTTQSGTGAAADDNGHGTHVTGIVASRGIVASYGVAPGCSIVAVKVLDAGNGFTFSSQVISGLNYVLSSHPEVRVVNASLGTFALFADTCDNATSFTMAFASAVNSLKANGTAVFASAGNQSSSSQMGAPACVQNTIAVGAVYDANFGESSVYCTESTAADKITCFSNTSTALDLLAPGAAIASDGLLGDWAMYYGTSQASPHAAGAAAVLFALKPSLTPDQAESALKTTGVSIFDSRIALSFPRIDVQAAVNSIGPFCVLDIAFPHHTDTLFPGNAYNIAFGHTAPCGANVKIDLYKAGLFHSAITASAPNNGAYSWTPSVALPSAADYRVKVTDLSTGISVFSEDGFTITGAPSSVVATGTSTQVVLSWSSPGLTGQYRVLRRDASSGGYGLVNTTNNTNYIDGSVSSDREYLYEVQRVDSYGNFATSSADLASTFTLADDPLAAGILVKQVHLTVLRSAVNSLRAAAGLGAFSFTDDATLLVRAIHVNELRSALDGARSAAFLPALSYSDTIVVGTLIKALHWQQLRDGLK